MKKLALLIIATFFVFTAYSAYLKNVPVELKQPDGSVIHCFVTGDEFHRRVHDKDNYTIVQDPSTGYYVYAILRGDELIPTSYTVGRTDPKTLSIRPGYDIPATQVEEKRATVLKSAKIVAENPTKGDFNSIVISIRFSDQSPTTLSVQDYENKFNSTSNISLKSYYKEVSNSQLNVTSYYFPKPQDQTILEYQDTHPRAYYSIYDANTNPIGYINDAMDREQTLFKNAVDFVKSQIAESQINIDINNDGFIDNLVFVMQGNTDNWGNILWPMTSSLASQVFIGSKQVQQYNKQLSTLLNADIISHEFFHSLGAPDLYRYTNKDIDPVGAWDIMGNTGAQHMTTYMKWKYGKWFDAIPEITQPGTYTLKPVSQSPYACYRIPSPVSSTEFFIIEYRKKEGLLESTLPTNYLDGLIIYRINTLVPWGNAGGPPDEVYIYRSLGDNNINGAIDKATFSDYTNRKTFNNESNPSCFLSNGVPGWIDISNVTSAENEISFTVNAVNSFPKPRNFIATAQNGQIHLSWNSPIKSGYTLMGYNIFLNNNSSPLNTVLLTDTTYLTPIPGQETNYTYKLTAKYQNGESNPVTCMFINTSNPSILDSLALVTLYNQCDGPNWQKTDNWLKEPLSTWYGVTVENNRVVELRLVGIGAMDVQFGLKNKIPKEIGNLTSLRSIEFDRNALFGNIPMEIGKLSSLQTLSLSFNALSGNIPKEIGNLTSLRTLYLQVNTLSGNIPKEIGNLKNLEDLIMFMNKLSGELPDEIWGLTNLKIFGVNQNILSGVIPDKIGQLVNLEEFGLGRNSFSGTIPKGIGKLLKLKNLGFESNKFSGTIPIEFYNLVNLKHFAFSVNQLSGTISPEIGNLKNLQTIGLWGNQFSGELPTEFGLLSKIEQIAIADNQFTGAIPKGLANFTEGVFFSFWNNQFNAFPDISDLTKMHALDIGSNCFTFEDIEPNMDLVLVPPDFSGLYYQPQAKIGKTETITAPVNQPYTLSIYCGGKNNRYQWFKNGQAISEIQTSPDFLINPVVSGTNGEFFCRVTNTIVPNLTIESNPITLIGANTLIANAGSDRGVDEGTVVTLDGTASFNPNGTPLIYKWTAPAGITLNSTTNAKPTFTAPEVNYDISYTFSLVVNDGTVDSPVNQVVITVKNDLTHNELPIANAGPDQTVISSLDFATIAEKTAIGIPLETRIQVLERSPSGQILAYKEIHSDQDIVGGTIVELNGSDSSDPDQDPLTYKWTSQTGITLSSTTAIKPIFTAPQVWQDTPYTFSLVVNDGTVDSPVNQVVVTIKNAKKAPVANAGIDQSVNEGATVSLNGSASSDSDGNILTYKWTAPAGISLSSTTIQKPTFIAHEINADTDYTFSLVVNDGTVDSSADQVIITVKQVNQTPVVNAGIDQNVSEGIEFTLDGSQSSDPDSDPLTYKWTAAAGITLNSTTLDKPTFTAPEVSSNTNYTFSLVVNDGTVDSPVDQVVITVKNVNKTPFANAGSDQSANEGSTATLDGSASSDPDGNPLTYKWTAAAGITINSTTLDKPTFTAPEVSSNTNYTFSLVVNDGTVDSPVDQVVITVKNVNKPPVANAGVDQSVNEGETISLDGSASSDPDENTLIYQWTEPAGITLSSTSEQKPTFLAPEVKKDSTLSFSLLVNDGIVNSASAIVNVTVLNVIKVGVSSLDAAFIKVYPNPTTGLVNIELTRGTGHKTEISVTSLVGSEIYRKEVNDASKFQIDLSNQVSGVYLLRVSNYNKQYITKIIIRKE